MFLKLWVVHILFYLVSPSQQLAGENKSSDNLNNIKPVGNGAIEKPALKRTVLKRVPIQITPQRLITRKKVVLNPAESAKLQNIIASNRTPIARNELKIEPVPDQNVQININAKSSSEGEKPQFFEDDVTTKKPKVNTPVTNGSIKDATNKTINETRNVSLKSIENESNKTEDAKPVVASNEVQTQDANKNINEKSKDTAKKPVENPPRVDLDFNKKNKTLNETSNVSSDDKISLLDNKKVLKITHPSTSDNSHVEPKESNNKKPNGRKQNFLNQEIIPSASVTKVDINVDPELMKELTDDANDKIFIKDFNYEELQEKYSPEETTGNKKFNKTPFKSDTNRLHTSILNQNKPIDKIWRTWKNTEIHIKSNDESKTNDIEPERDLYDCYGGDNFKPHDTINNIQPKQFHINKFRLIPFDMNKFNSVPISINKLKSIPTNINKLTSAPFDINKLQPDPFNINQFESVQFDRNKFDTTPIDVNNFEADNFDSTNLVTPIKYDVTYRSEPVISSNYVSQNPVRYYLPKVYTSSSFSTCYQPKSYGHQYAPVSRYQNYIFPCIY